MGILWCSCIRKVCRTGGIDGVNRSGSILFNIRYSYTSNSWADGALIDGVCIIGGYIKRTTTSGPIIFYIRNIYSAKDWPIGDEKEGYRD